MFLSQHLGSCYWYFLIKKICFLCWVSIVFKLTGYQFVEQKEFHLFLQGVLCDSLSESQPRSCSGQRYRKELFLDNLHSSQTRINEMEFILHPYCSSIKNSQETHPRSLEKTCSRNEWTWSFHTHFPHSINKMSLPLTDTYLLYGNLSQGDEAMH